MLREQLDRTHKIILAIIATSLLIGILYVFCVPAGLPYDEPAHFDNVRYYASHLRLPVLGAPETSYESYQAPLYYALVAPVDRLAQPLGMRTEFYVVRFAGLLLLVPLGFFTYRVALRIFGSDTTLTLLAVAFVCLNPALIAIAASVQNDMLSIVLSFWILDEVGRSVQDGPLKWGGAVRLGALIGAAMLAKMSVIFFPVPIAWFFWSRHGRASIRYMAIVVGTMALCTGWWFARNKLLYGDLMGIHAMQKLVGQSPSHIALWKPAILVPYLRNFLAHSWLPIEYFRTTFKASFWQRSVVMLFTLIAAAGWWIAGKDRNVRLSERQYDYRRFIFVAYGVCASLYFYTYITSNPYPPRVLYPMFMLYALFYAFGLCQVFRRSPAPYRRLALAVFGVVLIVLNFAMILKAKAYHTRDFLPAVNHPSASGQGEPKSP